MQAREDCNQFRIANGINPLPCHHKGQRRDNKDSCSKSSTTVILNQWIPVRPNYTCTKWGMMSWLVPLKNSRFEEKYHKLFLKQYSNNPIKYDFSELNDYENFIIRKNYYYNQEDLLHCI